MKQSRDVLSLFPLAGGEESPDRTGHPAVESTDRSNLVVVVTENNRLRSGANSPEVRVKM